MSEQKCSKCSGHGYYVKPGTCGQQVGNCTKCGGSGKA